MTRSFHKTKEAPHHCHTNAAGAVKSNPLKVKKEGHGGKGSWGSSRDEIDHAREILESGELPPISHPEREKSVRKLSISSSSTTDSTSSDDKLATNGVATAKITEEEHDLSEEPVAEEVEKAVA